MAMEVIQDLRETSYRCPVGWQNGRDALGVDCLEGKWMEERNVS